MPTKIGWKAFRRRAQAGDRPFWLVARKEWLRIFYRRGWLYIPGDADYLLSVVLLWPSVFNQVGYSDIEAFGEVANLDLLAREGMLSKASFRLEHLPSEPVDGGWSDDQPAYLSAVSNCLVALSRSFGAFDDDFVPDLPESVADEIGQLVWNLIDLDGQLLALSRRWGLDPLTVFARCGSRYRFHGVRGESACIAVRNFTTTVLQRIAAIGQPDEPIRKIVDAAVAGAGWSAFCRRVLLFQNAAAIRTKTLSMTEQDARSFVEEAITAFVNTHHDRLRAVFPDPVSNEIFDRAEGLIRQETNGALVEWLRTAKDAKKRYTCKEAHKTILPLLQLYERAAEPCPSLRELADMTGISKSTIHRTPAWQTYGAGRRPRTMLDPHIERHPEPQSY